MNHIRQQTYHVVIIKQSMFERNREVGNCWGPSQYRIPIIKIRRSQDRLIFIMGISILGKTAFVFKRGLDFTVADIFVISQGQHTMRYCHQFNLQYIPRDMHKVRTLFCFVAACYRSSLRVVLWLFYWHRANTIAHTNAIEATSTSMDKQIIIIQQEP